MFSTERKPWQKSVGAPVSGGFLADARTDSCNHPWQSLGNYSQLCLSDSGIQVFKKIPERNAASREQRPQWGVHGRREGGVGGERPIRLWITLVPSGSSTALESIKVLGSVLAHLGGNGASPPGSAVASALP